MKSTIKFLEIIILTAVIGFSMAACSNGSTGGGRSSGGGGGGTATSNSITYTGQSTIDSSTYTLKITENTGRAVYTPKNGDNYELTISSMKSTGSVTAFSNEVFTLKPSNSPQTTFSATVSGGSLSDISGTITWTDEKTATGPGTLTPGSNAKSIKITNITLTGRYGIWVFNEFNSDGYPKNIAIQSGNISGNALAVNLVTPRDNTWNGETDGTPRPKWSGNGNYNIALVPIIDNVYQGSEALIFTDSTGNAVKVTIDKALTTLDFGKFKKMSELDGVKSIKIESITSTGMIGIFVFKDLPQGNNTPVNEAIQYGTISGNTVTLKLIIPMDNTWNYGFSYWTGNGDFYVGVVPVRDNLYYLNEGFIFTNGGNAPVKVTFDKALTTLDFGKFKKLLDL